MTDQLDTILDRIRRYRDLLAANTDPEARKALQQLIREAEEQLPSDPDRHE